MKHEATLQLLVSKMEKMEKDIAGIKTELNELVYHPEENFRPEFVERVEKASKEGKYKLYKSVKELRAKLEQNV